jgi:activator of 2-hydroxyglutaryl-CoA dehydratase/predicted nucleotide-binding protein (sugar kinase/HSP70/actin superfamily)
LSTIPALNTLFQAVHRVEAQLNEEAISYPSVGQHEVKENAMSTPRRFLGIDIGAETIKVAELVREGETLRWTRRHFLHHDKNPRQKFLDVLAAFQWDTISGATVTGRFSRQFALPSIPTNKAQATGYRFLVGPDPATIVSVGSHGYSVLELREHGPDTFRSNSRCSQGTGNFLRQLCGRFGLSVEEASLLCVGISDPAALSGRCPVILKTDMTHLANKGESRPRILAGLFDAVCENVLSLIKPGRSPAAVFLIGGVSRSERVRTVFRESLAKYGMRLQTTRADDALFFDALGAAHFAANSAAPKLPIERIVNPPAPFHLERLPPIADSLPLVRRMTRRPASTHGGPREVILGFDIGSTGSKLVALDPATTDILWEGYRRTGGQPVEAAQALLREFMTGSACANRVLLLGATGSGREIVGSLMTLCFGAGVVYVLNEIAAHAEGALHYDKQVDTIFEIGGQDAKYIRLNGGRVVDCAMNEACSAGTGSFIEEQGCKFAGIQDVVQLNGEALAAEYGVSLGQHCSVFMAEIIEEAVAAGVEQRAIIAGLYDSIVQNYLHRVKGNRSIGQVIFCQGMPFAADALAAAVARQTGSRVVIPPSPGMTGALGIALLARRELEGQNRKPVDLQRLLNAAVEQRDHFLCKSAVGCGGGGNKCRIDCLRTVVDGSRRNFTWGGACSLYDQGTRKKKLPDLAPDPFRERTELVRNIIADCSDQPGRPSLAITDEFALNSLSPFFLTFLYECGFNLRVFTRADQQDLKRGIREAAVPFCAPMQLFHGLVSRMIESQPDILFLPMLQEAVRVKNEPDSCTCPIVQASSDLLRQVAHQKTRTKIVSPIINIGEAQLDSTVLRESCRRAAEELGVDRKQWQAAFQAARDAQLLFDDQCRNVGRRALDYCVEKNVTPVVVLGRTYTIYNKTLNSNIPSILREQGAIAIPVDCYPVTDDIPVFAEMFWGYGQRILRAAHLIRHTAGVYSLYCSNYSCGPDSFNLHFYAHIMEGKPFAIVETDGHSGDAGTKTRAEAFLHCVEQDAKARKNGHGSNHFLDIVSERVAGPDLFDENVRVLIPNMGPATEVLAACLRGCGIRAEALPQPDREALRIGRRHTSGKECLPACVTLGSVLQRVEKSRDGHERFIALMPRSNGPCRLGVYHLLDRIVLERLRWRDRVRIWSPSDADYFADFSPGVPVLALAGLRAGELLIQALYDVRPGEKVRGRALALYDKYLAELYALLESEGRKNRSIAYALAQTASGRLFGVRSLLKRAAREFAAIHSRDERPTVLIVGEIYVRCEPFSNDFVADKLEAHGLRVKFTPFTEWLDYINYLNGRKKRSSGLSATLNDAILKRVTRITHDAMAATLGWADFFFVEDSIAAARPYLREELEGEAVLTIGGARHQWLAGRIHGVISVGPLECMPNKIAEAHLVHAAEREGILSLTLSLNGDPIEPDALDNFIFDVKSRFRKQKEPARPGAGKEDGLLFSAVRRPHSENGA